jgi:hypothetical protein
MKSSTHAMTASEMMQGRPYDAMMDWRSSSGLLYVVEQAGSQPGIPL